MAIEHARAHALPKPWGIVDLRPWSNARCDGHPIGEVWYERPDAAAINSSLLLKLLFTNQPLSIQVHPDDRYAHSIGLPCGKTEAWYVLSAAPEAEIALGLNERLTSQQLREAIDTGSRLDIVRWQTVSLGDVIFVPAGTIHAIGAGVVIAEIQQRSDATFRLFDYGRQRELHTERAIAAADAGPADFRVTTSRLTDTRTLLIASEHFVFEKVDLPPNTAWCLEAERETWFLVVSGNARAGSIDVGTGDAIFMQADRVDIQPGPIGLVGLAAYASRDPVPHLLQRLEQSDVLNAGPRERQVTVVTQSKAIPPNERLEIIQ